MKPFHTACLLAAFLTAVSFCSAAPRTHHSRTVKVKRSAPVLVSPNLVSRWPGEGNAADVVGGHDGIPEGGVGFVPGRFGKAFALHGRQFVRIPFSLAFDFAPADRFTVSAWVKPMAVGHYQAILVKAPAGGLWEWGILIDPQNHFYTGRDAHDVAQSKTTVQAGHWYQVAVTYDAGALKLYVNGKLENQASGVFVGQSLGGLAMGHKGDAVVAGEDPDWFTGLIDEVRLYNRALSAPEVARLGRGQEVP